MREFRIEKQQIILMIIAMFALTVTKVSAVCVGEETYEVTFTGVWMASTHSQVYPAGAHWSGLVGGSHNNQYTMWAPGGQSTTGMKNMSEFGTQPTLLNEMKAQGNKVLDTLALSPISPGVGTRMGSLEVDGNHSLVSLVSMIAPSPDWFVGVRGLDLCNGTTWTQSITVDLFPYDAGTDSGLKFTSSDSATNPQEPIHLLTATNPNISGSSFFGVDPIPRFASLKFSLQSVSTTAPPKATSRATQAPATSCPGSRTYNVNFTTMWSIASHPKDYPAGRAHWSGLVGGSHNSAYVMWERNGISTPGLESVAETGSQSTLLKEMKAKGNNVLETIALSVINSGVGSRSKNLQVDSEHTLVSLVSMIAPSPDWFVGIHDVDLCNKTTFQWKENMTIDLFPYDAGTDNGLKFTSADDNSNPKETIHLLTGTRPNNTESSFYGYDRVPRMATMTLTLEAGDKSSVAGGMMTIIMIISVLVLLM